MATDKLRFLTGNLSDLANKATARGEVYFAIDGDNGKIVFDAPINSTTTKRIIMGNHVEFADKANSDSAGNEFISKYPFSFTTTTSTTTLKINVKAQNGDSVSGDPITIPAGTTSIAGLITTGTQSIKGAKTFTTSLTISTANSFKYTGISASTADADTTVWFSHNTTQGTPVFSNNFKYNASSDTLTVGNVNGLAKQASQDSAGNDFISKYPFSFSTTSNGTSFKINIKAQNGDSISGDPITVPNADADHAGIITNAAQNITGVKTFKTGVTIDKSSGFLYSGIESATGNAARPVWFAYDGVNGKPVYNANFTYNPSTKTLVAEHVTGTASRAIADSEGNNFISKYPYSFELDNEKTSIIIKAQNTDTLFTLSPRFLPLNGGHITGSLLVDDLIVGEFLVNGAARIIGDLYANLTGNVVGNVTGNVTGNADTATLAATASVAKLIENTLFIGSQKSFTGASDVYIGETLYYVVGSDSDTAGTWTGTNSAITSYYEGLTIIYVPKKAGASTTTLNINGLGATTCYYTNTSKLTTHFAVNTPIILTYYNNGWRRADYDSNTNTQVRIYKNEDGTYPIIGSRTAAASIRSGSTAVYGTIAETNPITMTPSSGTITATTFNGTATNATADELGNNFVSSYPFSFALDSTNTQIIIKSSNGDDHTTLAPAFLPLAGGTMTGDITFSDADIGIKRVGRSKSWHKGRDGALIKTTSVSSYSVLASIKTKNGSWDIGAYNNASFQDDLIFSYVADTLYDSSNATTTAQIKFLENGHIVGDLDGTATNAQKDSSGNEFISKYPFFFKETTSTTNYKISITASNGDVVKVKNTSNQDANELIVPAASATLAGLITTAAQTLLGLKTFTNTGNNDAGVIAENTDSSKSNKIGFINGASGDSGIYSYKHSKWVAYINTAGNAFFKGTADLTDAVNGNPATGDDEFTRVWFSYGAASNATNEKKRAYDDTYKYNSGTHTLNVTQYRINDHGLIKYDAVTESIVFSFV